ncbi:MAG: carboxypeptidase-like regulatory domain-containing protein [Gemmatimonadota bacterium]
MQPSSVAKRAILIGVAGLYLGGSRALAQPARAPTALRGVAYDSLRGQALAGAFVTIRGDTRTATSDAQGHFAFDGMTPGGYVLTLQHDALDSIGLSGITRRVELTADAMSEVLLSVPSFATMWKAACAGMAPSDSGLVYGTIRDASSRSPVPSAQVALSWLNLSASSIADIRQRRWRFDVASDSAGGFTFCGVPTDASLQLDARAESQTSGLLTLRPGRLRVHRVDLLLGKNASVAGARGMIVGRVTNQAGAPLRDARVVTGEMPEVRSGQQGEFTIRNVPTGTQQVEVLALGMLPVVTLVDVMEADTVVVNARLQRVTTLEGVNVTALSPRARIVSSFEERRQLGLGRFQDSTTIRAHGTLSSVFQEFLGIRVQYTRKSASPQYKLLGGSCTVNLFIDRVRVTDHAELSFLRPDEIAAVEVYARASTVPVEYQTTGQPCGAVAVWTKRFFP